MRPRSGTRGARAAPLPHRKPSERTLALLGLAALIVTAGLLAYANSFQGCFVLDDSTAIVANPALKTLWPPWAAMWSPKNTTVAGRPVVSLTLAVDHVLGRRPTPDAGALKDRMWAPLGDGQVLLARGFHVTNLLIHVLAALTLFGLVRRTLRARPLAERFGAASLPLAAAVALLWVVHPLHVVSVTYLSQRAESLMGLFYLLALYCAVRAFESPRRRHWPALSVTACLLGMGSKEVMASAPLAVLLYDRIFVSASFQEALRTRRRLYLGMAATWIPLLALVIVGSRSASVGFHRPEMTVLDYVKFQFPAISTYLRQAVWPQRLIFDYGQGPVPTFSEYGPPMAMVILLVLAVIVALFKRPAVGFAGACFFMILAPSSSFLPIVTERASYHRMYLPLAAVTAVVVCGAFVLGRSVLEKLIRQDADRVAWGRALAAVMTLAAVVGLGRATRTFNGIFKSEKAVWADVLAKMPGNERAQNNYGRVLLDGGRLEEAIPFFKRAIGLKPDFPDAWNNLGVATLRQGQAEQAVPYLREAIRLKPEYTAANMNMGAALIKSGKSDEAVTYYKNVLRNQPDFTAAMPQLAWILAAHPDPRVRNGNRAVEIAGRLCGIVPDNPNYLDLLAAAYAETGDWETAADTGRKAVAVGQRMLDTLPLDLQARKNLTDAMAVVRSHLRSYEEKRPIRDASLVQPAP
jgi:protein O-mannosyl-transferase